MALDVHAAANAAVQAINPDEPVIVQVSTGYTRDNAAKRTPTYAAPVNRMANVQSLSYSDIQHLDGLNLQGQRKGMFIYGFVDGLVRPANKGGDLITREDGSIWLVAVVLEDWGPPNGSAPQWCKVAVTLQNGA